MFSDRVLSGMRPTGRMHIGHYHGALKNWLRLQEEYDCLYFAADWHALTTHYETPERIEDSVWEMFIDWLAAGINPTRSTIFIQSRVVEHAELTLLLGMIAPVGWLERVPTYKEQQQKLADRDLTTFGFLGYPVMQAADILIYRANMVPVGEDQVSHLELVRELARRFNHIYGREADFEEKARAAIKKLGSKRAKRYAQLRTAFQEQGDQAALETAREMLDEAQNLALGDRERLFGYLEGSRRVILPEPHPLLTDTPKVPGTDGQKMSKSYDNAIFLREDPATITTKVRTMQTDPARVHRSDPGTPEKCPVWSLHQIYSDQTTRDWAHKGCTTAGIGCLDCKQPVIDAIIAEQRPLHERAQKYLDDPSLVRAIVADGCERARKLAEETMRDVRDAMGLSYT
jgi:tryptophanyl-tRNA synthetase